MHDQEREILSVIMDDEADTQGISKILNYGNRQSVQAQWYRWHQLRDLLKDGCHGGEPVFVDVAGGVRQALDKEPGDRARPGPVPGQSVEND